ncbi:MAG: hypothetical protein K2N91_08410 [Muribaculaceae bacterium]|nr:hypothetical protein [Muribaculaceae bacterium]
MYDDKKLKNKLKEELKGYESAGDIDELYNMITPNSLVSVALREIIGTLSDSQINHIRIGYGKNLTQAYEYAAVKGEVCRLVYIYFSELRFRELSQFIYSLDKDIIWGYTLDNDSGHRVKLVMIFN